MKQFNYIISGGGTGGHIYPALAIANEIKAVDPSASIVFVGALGKMEMEKVPKAGKKFKNGRTKDWNPGKDKALGITPPAGKKTKNKYTQITVRQTQM